MATDMISLLFTGLDEYAVGLERCELALQGGTEITVGDIEPWKGKSIV
jgi:hypothetical protein